MIVLNTGKNLILNIIDKVLKIIKWILRNLKWIWNGLVWIYHYKWVKNVRRIGILAVPLILLTAFIITHIWDFGMRDIYKYLLIACFFLPAIFFIWNILKFKLKEKENEEESTENNDKINVTNFSLLLSLFIFYATFFIGLLIFKQHPPEGEIPYLKDGTIGMSAWQSKVTVRKIKIHYHDSDGKWCLLPDSIVYNDTNWTMTIWNPGKLREQLNLVEKKTRLQKWFHPKEISIGDTVSLNFTNTDSVKSITIQNCTLIFTPQNKIQKAFHNIRFYCEVTFEKINKPENKLFPGFKLITFVDTNKVINEYGEKDFSDLCLEFNLGMNSNHHPWIPGLDYEPAIKYASDINIMKRYGNYDAMEEREPYLISAIIFNNKALFLGHTDGTVKLFEAQLSDNPENKEVENRK